MLLPLKRAVNNTSTFQQAPHRYFVRMDERLILDINLLKLARIKDGLYILSPRNLWHWYWTLPVAAMSESCFSQYIFMPFFLWQMWSDRNLKNYTIKIDFKFLLAVDFVKSNMREKQKAARRCQMEADAQYQHLSHLQTAPLHLTVTEQCWSRFNRDSAENPMPSIAQRPTILKIGTTLPRGVMVTTTLNS